MLVCKCVCFVFCVVFGFATVATGGQLQGEAEEGGGHDRHPSAEGLRQHMWVGLLMIVVCPLLPW